MRSIILARLTFQEAARRKILLAAVLAGLVFLVVFSLGLNFILEDIRTGEDTPLLVRTEILNFLTMAGLYVVNFLAIMLIVLTSVDTLSGEIDSGTVQTIVVKPLRRWEIVFGKWLGFTGLLTVYVIFMAGGVLMIVHLLADYQIPNALRGIGLLWLIGELMLTVSLMGGALLSTLANGVLVFSLFGISFVGGWIEQIGSFMENQAAINIGIITSLLMPSEALWKRAAFEMSSPLISALGFSPFSSGSVPSPLMVGYAGFYVVGMLAWAIHLFNQRDL